MKTIISKEFDVVVLGSGAAGLTAAITAKLEGLSVLLIEKTDLIGGSSAISGGAIWVPNNIYLEEAGLKYSDEHVKEYMRNTVGDDTSLELQEAYLQKGVEMVSYLREKTDMHWSYIPGYSDYYSNRPGGRGEGRTIEPLLFNLKRLGKHRKLMRRASLPTMGMVLKATDFFKVNMMARRFKGLLGGAKVAFRFARQILSFGAYKPVSLGEALVGRLFYTYIKQQGEYWLNTSLVELIQDKTNKNKITGVIVEKGDSLYTIKAKKGVLIATGGFSKNQKLREKYLPLPTDKEWTLAADGQMGDVIPHALKLGVELQFMDRVWGSPSVIFPNGEGYMPVSERAVPGMIIVDHSGKRYLDEVTPYHEFVDRMYLHNKGKESNESIPSWYLFDKRSKNRYLLFGILPMQPFPRSWKKSGFVKKAASIEELAKQIDVPVDNLRKTIDVYNSYKKDSVDKEFHRGESAHDRYYGDQRLKNPNYAPITKPPYFAIGLYPGDIGTKGGLKMDKHARVLSKGGEPFEGLYVAGNASASVMGKTYPGAGATIGSAMVFGYIAVKDMLKK